MRIEKPENDADSPLRPKSVVPPPNYSTRAIRMRLLTLFGMLILVIILMKEAGKPERWEWMGFDKQQKIELDSPPSTAEPESAFDASGETPPDDGLEFETPTPVGKNTAASSASPPNTSPAKPMNAPLSDNDYPGKGVEFWGALFQKMNADQQEAFLSLLKSMRLGNAIPTDQQENVSRLLQLVQRQRQDFHQRMFDELAITPNNSPEKTKLANDLYETQEIWDKKIFPAMEAAVQGEDITLSQQQAIIRLQQIIDPLLLQQVQDLTSTGWTGDSAAWKRLWEKTLGESPPGFDPVTRIQLMSQPDFYRGKPVTVEGWVRSARRHVLDPESELGIPHYYILWVRPKETKLGPFCIYSSSLPDGFPQLSDQFRDVNEHVRVDGRFFKIRTYVSGDKSVRNCPLVISRSLELIEAVSFTAVDSWQPSRTTLFTLLALIPVMATVLAWWAYRTSETRRRGPGARAEQGINSSLNELVDDPRVQTDQEKIRALYETETDSNDE